MLIATSVSLLWLAVIVAVSYGVLAHGSLPIWHERSQMYGANFDFGMLRALPSFLNGILLVMLFKTVGVRKKPIVLAGILVFALAVLTLTIFPNPNSSSIFFSLPTLFTA